MPSWRGLQPGCAAAPPGYVIERVVEGSGFHTVNGLAFGPDGRLFVASVLGESIFTLDLHTGDIAVQEAPVAGESDDLLFTPEGEMIWTALLEGAVRSRRADGTVRDLARGLPGANSIALTKDAKRLFVGQVFLGEGLWEVDLVGAAPPRLVLDDTGGLNACQFGPDGLLYAPSWDRGQVVRIDVNDGTTTILAGGFTKPGAVRFDANDQLYVLDDATGELFALDRRGTAYQKRAVAQLASATDNVIFGPNGLAYVSNMADNGIYEVDPATGSVTAITEGKLAFPRAIALTADARGDVLHVADSCAYRTIGTREFEIRDVARAVVSKIKFPTAVSATDMKVLLTGEAFGVVQLFDREGNHERDVDGFEQPSAALLLSDGSFLVAEPMPGRIVRVDGERRTQLAEGLSFPSGLADAGDGTVLVAESGAGRLMRIELATGRIFPASDVLGAVRSVAVGRSGLIATLDVLGGKVMTVDPSSGRGRLIAHTLQVGHLREPYPRSGGIAVGSDDTIYVSADLDNAIDRIRKE